ncbi:hypothetical protein [Vibrio agarivorans]|uniref:hypothetical protein n=1 Tax=Vibrio agarivorans TaxID=153622 RepID=UPI0025B2B7DE|nr:hypothetical protein [Vibrio agarivorans]MDN3660490.1 hypothetical protein [Vibrio agarivorans]
MKINPCLIALAAVTLPTTSFAQEQTVKSWHHSFEIYGLLLNISGDTQVGTASLDVDVDPDFILDHLEMTAMVRLEGIYHNQWGYYLDYSFMKLGGDKASVTDKNLGLLAADLDIRQGVLEAKGFKRYSYDFGSVDYMFGVRWWDNDIDLRLTGQNGNINLSPSIKEDWVDYVVGARWITDLTDNWVYHLSGDIGLGKDTRLTSSIQTGFRYRFNDWSDLNLAYKSTWVDYDNEDDFAYDTASYGLLIGLGLYF